MCNKTIKDIYVASCVETGGIFHYRLEAGRFCLAEIEKLDRPMYMIIEDRKMYIVLRAPYEDGNSGVVVYDIAEDGKLVNPSEIISTKGKVACHIARHNGNVYCANYISGSIVMLPDVLVQHRGAGKHPIRQEGPHVHYVGVTPDNKYICATDLGLDTIFVYRPDLTLFSSVKVPAGHGVRHLAFSEDGEYLFAINELESTVAAFSYADGGLELIDLCSILPKDYAEKSIAAAIRIDDGLIYASNRGHDSIAVLKFEENHLAFLDHIPCGGKTPRDFMLAGNYLLSANQDSNNVAVLDKKRNFEMVQSLNVEMPICVCTM